MRQRHQISAIDILVMACHNVLGKPPVMLQILYIWTNELQLTETKQSANNLLLSAIHYSSYDRDHCESQGYLKQRLKIFALKYNRDINYGKDTKQYWRFRMLQWAQFIQLAGSGSNIKPQTLVRKICPSKDFQQLHIKWHLKCFLLKCDILFAQHKWCQLKRKIVSCIILHCIKGHLLCPFLQDVI